MASKTGTVLAQQQAASQRLSCPCRRPVRASRRSKSSAAVAARATAQPPANGGGLSYKQAGVDIDAGDELVRRIQKLNPSIGGFSGLVPFGDSYLVAGTDGVGTKLKLAFDMNKHDTVGIDLVAMSVNDIVTSGAQPLFFLDYYATGALDVDAAEQVRRPHGACMGGVRDVRLHAADPHELVSWRGLHAWHRLSAREQGRGRGAAVALRDALARAAAVSANALIQRACDWRRQHHMIWCVGSAADAPAASVTSSRTRAH